MSNGPQGSGNRWWEIRGAGQPDEGEGGYRELMTDSRGRSRPERSLSVGVDLAEESRSSGRALLWPIVAAVGLILSVIVVVATGKSHHSDNALAAPPAPQSSAPGTAAAAPAGAAKPDRGSPDRGSPDRGSRASAPPDRPRQLPPAERDTLPPAAAPAPAIPAVPPNGPTGNPNPGAGNQPAGALAPNATAPAQDPSSVKFDSLDGAAPPTPTSKQVGAVVPGSSGCAKSTDHDGNDVYRCAITRDAPYYLAGKRNYDAILQNDQLPFLCQSNGSKYSVADRVSHWWARLEYPDPSAAAWVPVVFLKGAPSDDKPVPGLPLCAGASEPTATKAPTSAEPRTKSTHSTPDGSDWDRDVDARPDR